MDGIKREANIKQNGMKREAKIAQRKRGGSKATAIIVIVIAASLVGSGLYMEKDKWGVSTDTTQVEYSNTPYNSIVNYTLFRPSGLNQTVDYMAINPKYNSLTGDYRPMWHNCTNEQYLQIFGALPKFPQDFYKKYSMFMQGELSDYDRLGPEYYEQPEFYGLNQLQMDNYMTHHMGQWTPGVVSCKPSAREVELQPGASVALSTFFHMGLVSEAYLGAVFYAYLPDAAINYDGIKVFDQPQNAGKYIHLTINEPNNDSLFESEAFQNSITGLYTNVDKGEKIVLFAPTYHLIDTLGVKINKGFQPGWCHKVTVNIAVDVNCPPGTYDVAVDMKNPSKEVVQEYNWMVSGYPYFAYFFPAIREWRPICPFFQIIVVVI